MPLPPYRARHPRPEQVSPEDREPPPLLAELSYQQWQEWKRHPVTAMLFERYLPDFRYQLERDALDAWMGNNIPLAQQEHARAHLLGAYEMEQMTLDRVRIFYGLGARPSPTDASQKRNDLGY